MKVGTLITTTARKGELINHQGGEEKKGDVRPSIAWLADHLA
tara:strand:- start:1206 stop:1331 length:126 start_codon:yes stop_codon:yes gene_type:complete